MNVDVEAGGGSSQHHPFINKTNDHNKTILASFWCAGAGTAGCGAAAAASFKTFCGFTRFKRRWLRFEWFSFQFDSNSQLRTKPTNGKVVEDQLIGYMTPEGKHRERERETEERTNRRYD